MITGNFSPGTFPLLVAVVVLYLVQSPLFMTGVVSARVNWTCAQLYDDIPSRTALATIVFEGRARRLENLPSSVKPVDREHFNVTFKPRRLFKGNLPRTDGGSFEIITVGVFGLVEDRSACVPSVQLGSRYLVFLQGQGVPSEYDHQLSFFQIFSFPEPFSPESASLAAEYACSNCTNVPTVSLLPSDELEIMSMKKLILRCLVTGRPYPVVTWYKNGLELVAAKRVKVRKRKLGVNLHISKVKSEDAGSYSCLASSVLGEVRSNASLVSIASAPTSFRPHAVLCSSQNFCLNGGVCYTIPTLGKKFCKCESGFTGMRCQDRDLPLIYSLLARSHDILRLETILIAAILAVVIILLITLLFLVCTVCRMRDNYSKVLLNSSRSKQSLRLDRMVALATVNHLPSFCDVSSQTDSQQINEFALNRAVEASYALPAKQKYNKCTTTHHNYKSRDKDPPAPTGCNIVTSGCNGAVPNCGKLAPANCTSSSGCHQRHSDGFVSTSGLTSQGANYVKQGGCNPGHCAAGGQTGCNRLSAGSGISVGCSSKLSSSGQDCSQGNYKPTSSVVTVAQCEMITSPTASKRDSATSVATVPVVNNLASSSSAVGCSNGHCSKSPAVNCYSRPCSDVPISECKPLNDEIKSNRSQPLNHRSTSVVVVVETEDVLVQSRPLSMEYNHTDGKLSAIVQNEDILCSVMPANKLSQEKKISDVEQQSSPNSNSTNSDCDNSLHPPFVYGIPTGSAADPSEMSSPLERDPCSLDPEVGCQRVVHTVPKHTSCSSSSKRNVLSERCSSDYERNSPASDLEVNMESEVDIQALNASEEELGRELGQPRLLFHNNYESSVDTTDSESSLSSHDPDQPLLNRLKSQQPHLMDSSMEERAPGAVRGGGGEAAAPVELDWEKFSCPFNFGAIDHTFTLNPYDVIYANKYLARNQSRAGPLEKSDDSNNSDPASGGIDQYPYDPDPDATVV